MKRKTWIIIIIVALILIGIVTYIIRSNKNKEITAIMDAINKGTNESGDYHDLEGGNALSTTYWQKFNFNDDDKARATDLAKQIYDALGYFQTDDVQSVYSALSAAGTQAFMSLISYEFEQAYGKSVLTHLYHMSYDEINKANDIINQLPLQ